MICDFNVALTRPIDLVATTLPAGRMVRIEEVGTDFNGESMWNLYDVTNPDRQLVSAITESSLTGVPYASNVAREPYRRAGDGRGDRDATRTGGAGRQHVGPHPVGPLPVGDEDLRRTHDSSIAVALPAVGRVTESVPVDSQREPGDPNGVSSRDSIAQAGALNATVGGLMQLPHDHELRSSIGGRLSGTARRMIGDVIERLTDELCQQQAPNMAVRLLSREQVAGILERRKRPGVWPKMQADDPSLWASLEYSRAWWAREDDPGRIAYLDDDSLIAWDSATDSDLTWPLPITDPVSQARIAGARHMPPPQTGGMTASAVPVAGLQSSELVVSTGDSKTVSRATQRSLFA